MALIINKDVQPSIWTIKSITIRKKTSKKITFNGYHCLIPEGFPVFEIVIDLLNKTDKSISTYKMLYGLWSDDFINIDIKKYLSTVINESFDEFWSVKDFYEWVDNNTGLTLAQCIPC